MDNRSMIETEEEEESTYVFEGEVEEIMESEEEEIMKSEEEEEEEAEQLEEIRPPVMTSWMDPDGITVHGIMCIDDGIIRLKNRCQLDDCPICYKPSATHGKHQQCCLPCGHTYGFSCIKKWLLQSSSSGNGKCPQCNTLCSFKDAILLYPPRRCVTAHQKASSAALFPFTKQGYIEFKEYESSRMFDAGFMRADDVRQHNIIARQGRVLVDRAKELNRKRYSLLEQADELELEGRAESLGGADALRRRATQLNSRIEALKRRTAALNRLYSALRRRMDALQQRSDAFESRMDFYLEMYKEHHIRQRRITMSHVPPAVTTTNISKDE